MPFCDSAVAEVVRLPSWHPNSHEFGYRNCARTASWRRTLGEQTRLLLVGGRTRVVVQPAIGVRESGMRLFAEGVDRQRLLQVGARLLGLRQSEIAGTEEPP